MPSGRRRSSRNWSQGPSSPRRWVDRSVFHCTRLSSRPRGITYRHRREPPASAFLTPTRFRLCAHDLPCSFTGCIPRPKGTAREEEQRRGRSRMGFIYVAFSDRPTMAMIMLLVATVVFVFSPSYGHGTPAVRVKNEFAAGPGQNGSADGRAPESARSTGGGRACSRGATGNTAASWPVSRRLLQCAGSDRALRLAHLFCPSPAGSLIRCRLASPLGPGVTTPLCSKRPRSNARARFGRLSP